MSPIKNRTNPITLQLLILIGLIPTNLFEHFNIYSYFFHFPSSTRARDQVTFLVFGDIRALFDHDLELGNFGMGGRLDNLNLLREFGRGH